MLVVRSVVWKWILKWNRTCGGSTFVSEVLAVRHWPLVNQRVLKVIPSISGILQTMYRDSQLVCKHLIHLNPDLVNSTWNTSISRRFPLKHTSDALIVLPKKGTLTWYVTVIEYILSTVPATLIMLYKLALCTKCLKYHWTIKTRFVNWPLLDGCF